VTGSPGVVPNPLVAHPAVGTFHDRGLLLHQHAGTRRQARGAETQSGRDRSPGVFLREDQYHWQDTGVGAGGRIRSKGGRVSDYEALSHRAYYPRGDGAYRPVGPEGRRFSHPRHADRHEHYDRTHDPRIGAALVTWSVPAAICAVGSEFRLDAIPLTAVTENRIANA